MESEINEGSVFRANEEAKVEKKNELDVQPRTKSRKQLLNEFQCNVEIEEASNSND